MPNANSAYYASQRRGIRSGAARELATNAYARELARQRGSRQLADLQTDYTRSRQNYDLDFNRYNQDRTRQYKQGYAGMASQFGARGLAGGGVQSGVQQAGVGRYTDEYGRDIGRARSDYQTAIDRLMQTYNTNRGRSLVDQRQEMYGFDMTQADIIAQRQEALRALRAERARDRALRAQYLTALRPYLT